MSWVLVVLLNLALVTAWVYTSKLRAISQQAPQLSLAQSADLTLPVSVVIPAYNEAENIEPCLLSVLNSTDSEHLEVWVVNDQSTDATWTILQTMQQSCSDPRLHLLQGQPRPEAERWVGKNWACTQAAEQAKGEFLLFIDADVRLHPGAIETAVQTMQQEQIDLLSCVPAIECGCLAEWLVQPLVMSTIMIGFDLPAINDPATDYAFAAGPFMLFRRIAYDKIGGHRAVADQVVEDVELARRVKFSGMKLRFVLATALGTLRMYRSGEALWEGWTKNFYLGTQRNLKGVLRFMGLILIMCTLPWISLPIAMAQLLSGFSLAAAITLILALIAIVLHYQVRRQLVAVLGIPPRYWWLTGLGGVIVTGIAVASIIKTETGWGWTWRGRQLKPDSNQHLG